jgi:hypothetical protein
MGGYVTGLERKNKRDKNGAQVMLTEKAPYKCTTVVA